MRPMVWSLMKASWKKKKVHFSTRYHQGDGLIFKLVSFIIVWSNYSAVVPGFVKFLRV